MPRTFAVNLVTGDYRVAADHMGTSKPVNALGFNPVDNYIYGWSKEHNVPVRVNNDFSFEVLAVDNIANKHFYVGDVHPQNNEYYVYRRGQQYGLYKIQLNPDSADYLSMQKIIDGKSLSMKVADMAINPADGYGYALSKDGDLFRIDLASGDHTILANSGIKGLFGAAYFDPDGNFYVSRNNDGQIYRISVGTANYTAEFFSAGPSSNINDGSRCAIAPINPVVQTNLDFGDAPDSYGSSLENNGARHVVGDLYLGSGVDSESDSSAFPLSDDDNNTTDDEDGVQFATSLTESKCVRLLFC